jgi:putative hemolysin
LLGEIGILFILILLNSIFAATEIAIISVNQTKLRKQAEEGDKKAILLKKMTDNPSGMLATIQIGISIIALFSGAFAAQSFAGELTGFLLKLGVPISETVLSKLSVVVITLLLSYFELVLGELVPKRVAMKNPDAIAQFMATPIHKLSVIGTPIVKLLTVSTNLVAKLFGVEPGAPEEDVTEEEIRLMVDAGGDNGAIDESEMEMINNVFEFDDKTADDICTHRTDIIALPVDAEEEEIHDVLINEKFSRIPVYEDSIDNIVGILYIKDVMKYIIDNNLHEIDLRQIIRKPYFVPFSIKTDELFADMQKDKIPIAVVLDEYGGTSGIITMEDLIEEVMGNIFDEYDEEETPDIIALDENTFKVVGSADLSEVAEYFDIELPDEDYNTLAGFLLSQLGRIPVDDEQPEVEFNGLLFKVNKVEERRIEDVTICRTMGE